MLFNLLCGAVLFFQVSALPSLAPRQALCDYPQEGFQRQPDVSHFWGQYSPYYAVRSEIPTEVPDKCKITFVQLLSRHGSRDPTASKTTQYNATIAKIKSKVPASAYTGQYAFLKEYNYTLGADALTLFGQQEMINSGIAFFERYSALAKGATPFVRSSGEARVVESAQNWTQGYHLTKLTSVGADHDYPYTLISIPEADGVNNTLNHDLCDQFENNATYSSIASTAQSKFAATFIPAIQARLNTALPGANLSSTDTINMIDLCPFNTIASPSGQVSAFCSLFSLDEFRQYDYYETLGKYYGYGAGNPLGPTQGVGFTNELLARLTNTPVKDHTSTNSTLDSDPASFPLGGELKLYADFSHDNDMTGIFYALGLFNSTPVLTTTAAMDVSATNGYSAAWTVPFASRAYFEKMQCEGEREELVRVLINERVIPLREMCGGDRLGRCRLSKFVGAMSFAREGGHWDICFA
ncbi:3-phytase A [Dacryopinax primogenitus]|uniref:Phytase A n=1 Tax=Dacryopinax primogenitus (strain DJM 731) TaxID=1858805 RepID=M5FWL4_DACPD|nr:3-phytase A [Dacryopinax primogenitus]EJT97811.1 3-phytase A [Dacryopinax primogenitus]